jgi:hypothetical protein
VEANRRDLALFALSLLHGDRVAPGPTPDTRLLAEGQAFLNGFIVQELAEAMHISVPEALEHLRRLLAGGPEGAGVREPRRPAAPLPSMAAERDLGDDT